MNFHQKKEFLKGEVHQEGVPQGEEVHQEEGVPQGEEVHQEEGVLQGEVHIYGFDKKGPKYQDTQDRFCRNSPHVP